VTPQQRRWKRIGDVLGTLLILALWAYVVWLFLGA
jgi:hypothetical protein